MKKAEMDNLKVGQVIIDTRTNGEHKITQVNEANIVIDDIKKVALSTLKRYFKLIKDVEVEVPNILVVSNQLLLPAPQVEKQIDQKIIDDITHGLLTVDELIQISENYGCTVKKCNNYTAVKFNDKSVCNIYNSKRKGIYPAFNKDIFTEEQIDCLDEAQEIGKGKWVCNLKFRLTSCDQYGQYLEKAINLK